MSIQFVDKNIFCNEKSYFGIWNTNQFQNYIFHTICETGLYNILYRNWGKSRWMWCSSCCLSRQAAAKFSSCFNHAMLTPTYCKSRIDQGLHRVLRSASPSAWYFNNQNDPSLPQLSELAFSALRKSLQPPVCSNPQGWDFQIKSILDSLQSESRFFC